MTAREKRRHAVTASVIVVSGLTLAGSQLLVADVDRARREADSATARQALHVPEPPDRPRLAQPAHPSTDAPLLASRAPAAGLVRAPAPPRRRVIVARRTRAS